MFLILLSIEVRSCTLSRLPFRKSFLIHCIHRIFALITILLPCRNRMNRGRSVSRISYQHTLLLYLHIRFKFIDVLAAVELFQLCFNWACWVILRRFTWFSSIAGSFVNEGRATDPVWLRENCLLRLFAVDIFFNKLWNLRLVLNFDSFTF